MLNYSKERKPVFELQDINGIVDEVATLMEQKAKDSSIALEKNLDKNMPKIEVDHEGMHRCVLNLVTNAMDAVEGKKGSKITLTTSYDKSKDQATIEIKDNGCGIPKDKLSQVFNIFHTTKSAGTGLGLAVCKKIIDQHKGEIGVDSEQEKYTAFIITLDQKQDRK